MKSSAAVILAGGKSTRFGSDKAFAKFGDSTLVESVFYCLKKIFENIIIVTNNPGHFPRFDALIVKDRVAGKGPLGGIYTGLKMSISPRIFVFACDMPFLNEGFINYMISIDKGDVIVPKIGCFTEPLHAIYSLSCLEHIEKQLLVNDNKIQNFFGKVDTVYIAEKTSRKFDPELKMFFNINEKKDITRIINV
ncbi:molybdenum cofactor guanylyltransferase [candidate division WOR-3 bacterium]|nr:molybdenum cofactor guanylyltransferase [candidate division WOR-3 bacterium]